MQPSLGRFGWRAGECSTGGWGARRALQLRVGSRRKQEAGRRTVHDVDFHGASARPGGCVQGPDALGTGGVDLGRTRVGRAVAVAAAAAAAAICASPGTTVLLGLGLC